MAHAFPHFRFGGTPSARGSAYGETLRERIQATYALYADSLFSGSALSSDDIRQRADIVRILIDDFSPDYTAELDALAQAANLARWQVYALNARTEILNAAIGECTAIYFEQSRVLGQTWDWVAPLEDLAVLVTWELPNDHSVLTLTEPGMLGKIGLNDRGLGVCLNILFSPHELDGVPVHILTRAVLDCGGVDEARAMLSHCGFGKASHLLLGDAAGNCCSMEFAAGERFEGEVSDGVLLHTNHCVAPGAANKAVLIPTTLERLQQANTKLEQNGARDLEALRQILLDGSAGALSINASYHPEPLLDNQDVGTCATVLMDLGARRMEIKKGPGNGEFLRLDV